MIVYATLFYKIGQTYKTMTKSLNRDIDTVTSYLRTRGVTVVDMCESLGMKRATLYQIIGSKGSPRRGTTTDRLIAAYPALFDDVVLVSVEPNADPDVRFLNQLTAENERLKEHITTSAEALQATVST